VLSAREHLFYFQDVELSYTDNRVTMNTTRRDFIKKFSLTTAGLYGLVDSHAFNLNESLITPSLADSPKISVFSKNLQWLDYDAMAETARDIGFDGIDLTVRPNGHVLPENVVTDLPKAVAAVRKAGLEVYEVTTAITEADADNTEQIIATLSDLGVKYYRLNWFEYEQDVSMDENISHIKLRMEKLAALNEKHQVHGAYQNHAGASFGASVWDLWEVMKDLNPQFIGCQFDVRHATVEGSNSWVSDFKRIQPWIKSYNIKDFAWTKKENRWQAQSVPLGEGMVDFKKYFELIRQYHVTGPVSMHFEYPLGGADQGAKTISIPKQKIIQSMRTDLIKLKELMVA
jgi:L-ribulose-5-phosphate 3-epimerase